MRAFAHSLYRRHAAAGILDQGSAQTPADFFKGRTIDLYIGYSVGGGYDVYARMIARHMGRHIPGNPDRHSEEHGRSGQHPAGELAL